MTITVRRNPDGSLDELFVEDATVHLEQMADGHWWLCIEKQGFRHVINLATKRGAKIIAVYEVDE